jgi:hypothetical protein
MGQRLIISEEERSQINKMYELVNEQNVPGDMAPMELQYLYDKTLIDTLLKSEDAQEIYNSFRELLNSDLNRNWNRKLLGDYKVFEDYLAMNPAVFPELDQRLRKLYRTIKDDTEIETEERKRALSMISRVGQTLNDKHENGQRKSENFKRKVENLQPCRRIDDETINSINDNKVMVVKAFDDKVLIFRINGQPICAMK